MPKDLDWTGNKRSTFAAIAASNHSESERETHDYYATDPNAIKYLIEDGCAEISENVWECACGEKHLSRELEAYGKKVRNSDLIDRIQDGSVEEIDFLNYTGSDSWDGDILTNPPYKYAKEFVEKSMDVITKGHKVFMFLKLTFLETKGRRELFDKYPPKCVYVSSSRIPCAKNGNFDKVKEDGGSAVAYAWYEWEKGYTGNTIIKWIN